MRRHAIVVRGERSAVSERAEILRRIEAVRGDAEAPDRATATGGEVSLAAILDDGQPVAGRDGRNPVHICGLTVEMHRDDGGRPRCDRRASGRGSIVSLTGSMSAKTGRAPTIMMASAV